jgi:hypothetical protein
VLSLSLACPTVVATAVVPSVAVASPASDEAALAEARALFDRGRSKYDTFDYTGAIDLWQQAYAKVPDTQAGVRNAMVYNIALAQEKAFEVDKDVGHLRQAVMLLESWVESYKAMFKKTPETEAEVAKAQSRIAELKARIADIEGGGTGTQTPAIPDDEEPPAPPQIAFDTGYTPPPDVLKQRDKARAVNKTERRLAAGWTLTGIGGTLFLIGAGVTAFGGTASTVDENMMTVPPDPDDRRAAIAGGVTVMVLGTGLLIPGAILLAKGYKQKKAIAAGDYSLAPYFNRSGGGAAFRMRF